MWGAAETWAKSIIHDPHFGVELARSYLNNELFAPKEADGKYNENHKFLKSPRINYPINVAIGVFSIWDYNNLHKKRQGHFSLKKKIPRPSQRR